MMKLVTLALFCSCISSHATLVQLEASTIVVATGSLPPGVSNSTGPVQSLMVRFGDPLTNPALWTATVVPEPAGVSLLAMAGLGLLVGRSRRA